MVFLEISNKVKIRFCRKRFLALLEFAQKFLADKRNKNVSLAFVSVSEIKKLNKIYRGKDKATDVLSFSLAEKEVFGEIIICSSVAKKQALKAKQSFQRECEKLLLHGFLHLYGYDHENNKEAVLMEGLESEILKKYYAKF